MCAAVACSGADELRGERDAEVGVEDDAEERAAASPGIWTEESATGWILHSAAGWILHSAAVSELRIVGQDGVDAGEDGVGGVAEELHLVSRGGAGEPEGLVGIPRGGWWSQFSVDGQCSLEGDEGGAVLDGVGEGVVQIACRLLEDAERYFDVASAEFLNALAADLWVGVLRGDDAAGDASSDEGVGAGAGASVMTAGLEGDVGGGSFGGEAAGRSLFERYDLGVVAVVV
jgi:hypothetical protein